MTKSAHTPTPWEVADHMILGATRTIHVASCVSRDPNFRAKKPQADAAFIVRAVNSHDVLVEALEGIAAQDEFTGGEPGSPIAQAYAILNALRLKARAALTLAKGD